jgi:hypothetical protein
MGYEVFVVRLIVSFVCLVASLQAWTVSRSLDKYAKIREAARKAPIGSSSGDGGYLRYFGPLDVDVAEGSGGLREGALVAARFSNPELARLVGYGSVSVVETSCFSPNGGVRAYRVGDAPPGTHAAEEKSVSGEPGSPAIMLYAGTGIVPVTAAEPADNSPIQLLASGCHAIAY